MSSVKNKERRIKLFKKFKVTKRRERKKEKHEKQMIIAKHGPDAVPTKPNKTIETEREPEETAVHDDAREDIIAEEATDEYSEHYNKEITPKVMITAADKPYSRLRHFLKEMERVIPNSELKFRKKTTVKQLAKFASKNGYTDLMIFNEDNRRPNSLLLVHLPEGPTAFFRLSGIKICKEIRRDINDINAERPEVLLNHFTTQLGRVVGRMLGAVFHHSPEYEGRRVCTFHNQRDFIFFRNHIYQFKSEEKVGLRELGPRFTLQLQWLQRGIMDGDYEWVLKRREQETSRTRFML